MKTNKEKALELLIDSFAYQSELEQLVRQAIELSSKPDWYYPSKGEYPEYNELFVDSDNVPCVMLVNFKFKNLLTNSVDSIGNIYSWTYLPKFEEDDNK